MVERQFGCYYRSSLGSNCRYQIAGCLPRRSRNRLRNPSNRGNWKRSHCYAGLYIGLASDPCLHDTWILHRAYDQDCRIPRHQISAIDRRHIRHVSHSYLYDSYPLPSLYTRRHPRSTSGALPSHQYICKTLLHYLYFPLCYRTSRLGGIFSDSMASCPSNFYFCHR